MNLLLDTKKYLVQLSIVFAVFSFGLFTIFADTHKVIASDNNFTDGITVDSKLDTADANVGNNICDDGAGNCTLRAAIEESNATTGTQTITFNISGTADFTNGGQNGYTIQPTSGLPQITDTVNIDGYTQPGAQANTAIAPNPLNGRLLVELNGDNAGVSDGLGFFSNSNNSTIKGLVINGFDQGNAIFMLVDNIVIRGNYIGANPAGNSAKPNVVGVNTDNSDPNEATGVLVGGLNPADRNLISGNTAGTTGTASYPGTNWVFYGNYIGVAADGLTPLDNSTPSGSGQLSVDNCTGVIIGGNQTGAINVLGASLGHGIAPHEADNLTIEGNYIGFGYDGTTALGNATLGSYGAGIAITNSDTVSIANNKIAGWKSEGIYIGLGNSNATFNNNYILDNTGEGVIIQSPGMIFTNNTVTNGALVGININTADNIVSDNIITNNNGRGIDVTVTNNTITDNIISDNTDYGILLSSTDNLVSGNTFSTNGTDGINVTATNNTITGNTITDNTQSGINISASDNTISDNIISSSSQSGIYINSGATVNNIIDNTISTSAQFGIDINATNNTISSNTISSSTQSGINVSASDNIISNNTISSSTQRGININAVNNTISSNTVSSSSQDGIYLNSGATGNTISSNTVSTSTQSGISVNAINSIIAGNTVINNTIYGISVETSDNTILDNLISNNHGPANIYLGGTGAPISNLTIQGNKIGTKADGTIDNSYTQNIGILLVGDVSNLLIGGSSAGDGNIIAGNNGAGIANSGMDISGFGVSPNKLAIMGNSIYSNNSGSIYGFALPGLGIDNYMVNLDGSFVPQSTTEEGVTPNDSNDTDTGPNNYMNFPVLQSATQTNDTLALTYDLDAADSPTNQYRVEFFANDVADPSGNGEGQTYLGSVTATNGTGNTANLTLPSGTNLTGKVLSATTTAIDTSTPSDFGSTSEFSENAPITVLSTGINAIIPDQLASTGDNLWLWLTGMLSLIGVGVYVVRVVGWR